MTNGAENLFARLAENLANATLSHVPTTEEKDHKYVDGYSINIFFPESSFWESLNAMTFLSSLAEQGAKNARRRKQIPDSTRREVRVSILRRAETERAKARRKRGRSK